MIEIPEETLKWMDKYMAALRSNTKSLDIERERIEGCIVSSTEDMEIARALVAGLEEHTEEDDDGDMIQAFRERVLTLSAAIAMFQMMLVVWDHQQKTGMPLKGDYLSKFNNLRGGDDVTGN